MFMTQEYIRDPLASFISKHERLSMDKFLKTVKGPFLVGKAGREEAWILDLNAFRQSDSPSLRIGRDENADLIFNVPGISRRHARILYKDSQFFIEDLGSRNGTKVGKRLEPNTKVPLKNNGLVKLGRNVRLIFVDVLTLYLSVFSSFDPSKNSTEDTLAGDERKVLQWQQMLTSTIDEPQTVEEFAHKIRDLSLQDFLQVYPNPVLIRLYARKSGVHFRTLQTEVTKKIKRPEAFVEFERVVFYPLDKGVGRYSLGRSIDNDIVIEDVSVSRNHAALEHDGRSWTIRDLDSTEGTRINDKAIEGTKVIYEEDKVQMGDNYVLQYMTPVSFYNFARRYLLSTSF